MKRVLDIWAVPPSLSASLAAAIPKVITWGGIAVLTAIVCLVAGRLSLVLGSPLVLCAAYAVPAALAMRSLIKGFFSFCAVTVVGTILLQGEPPGARLSFVLVGIFFTASALFVSMGWSRRLSEARHALGIIRMKSQTTQDAVQLAGVCVVVVARNLTWLSVNDAAWNAFGADMSLRKGMDARVDLDDEAATALMHSGSQEAWRAFFESVIADGGIDRLGPGEALPPYKITLYNSDGQKKRYCFTVSGGQRGEAVFVGFPAPAIEEPGSSSEQSPAAWFEETVQHIESAAVVVQSDGALLAANAAFWSLCGDRSAAFIFDCPCVRGASEMTFASDVWMPTRSGSQELPKLYLEGGGRAKGKRVSPPNASYVEAALLVFNVNSRAASDSYVTRPRPL